MQDLQLKTGKTQSFFFQVPNRFEVHLRRRPDLELLSSTQAAYVRFTCQDLEEIAPKMDEVMAMIEEKEKQLLVEVTAAMQGYPVKQLSDLIALLDVIVSLAVTATSSSYVRPEILEKGSGILSFTRLRHPCLDDDKFVPNDVLMSPETGKCLLITGK